jgi:protein-S-isoprenylcysteine O-methyltransferase Ste14
MSLNWAALCIGLIVGAYWARVLKLVLKARRLTGRAANFLPPEPLGRVLRIVWYPTVLTWIVYPILVGIMPDRMRMPPLRPLFDVPIVAACAVAVALAALGGSLVCWKRMGKSWRMGIDPSEKTQLVVSGPYAYVRHPIYALSSLLMTASVVAVPTPLMFIVGAVHLFFLQWEARREERHLLASHGDQYRQYLRHVGRFVPRSFSPYHPG